MSDVRDLYREVILDHSRRPRNRGSLEGANRRAEGFNPLCGDRVVLALRLDDEGVIREAMFTGEGCAISTAAASTLTEALPGLGPEAALALMERFRTVATGDAPAEELSEQRALAAFAGVASFPTRVKCATLCWHALEEALRGEGRRITGAG